MMTPAVGQEVYMFCGAEVRSHKSNCPKDAGIVSNVQEFQHCASGEGVVERIAS